SLYSHFKMIAVSGVVGTNHAASVVWTGSNNFTNDGVKYDEVTMRIASRAAYQQYVDQFAFITRTRTAGTHASFADPLGRGGDPERAAEHRAEHRLRQAERPPRARVEAVTDPRQHQRHGHEAGQRGEREQPPVQGHVAAQAEQPGHDQEPAERVRQRVDPAE